MAVLLAHDDGVVVLGPDGVETLLGGAVTSLATDADGHPWTLHPDGAVRRHDGTAWFEVGRLGPSLRGSCLLPRGDHALVGTHEAHLARVDADGCVLLEGFEHAPGRDRWYTPWGGPPSTRSLTVSPDGALLANVHVGGLLRSDDDGTSWEPLVDIELDVHQVAAGPDGLLVAACGAGGMVLSDDGGRHWHHAVDGLHGTYCRAVALADGHALVSASTGPFTNAAALYRADLAHPGRFERCDRGLPEWFGANIDTHWVAGRDQTAAVATDDGEVYLSLDAGKHWDRLAQGLATPVGVLLT